MKHYVTLLLSLLIILTTACTSQPAPEDEVLQDILDSYPQLTGQPYMLGYVKRVVDGDTFELGSGEKVRLIGVNTPEIFNGKNEAFGQEAKRFAEEVLEGKEVYLFADAGDTDRYGRWLRYVFLRDGSDSMMFNERLLYEGYANVMSIAPNVIFADYFAAVERKAREHSRGLWAENGIDGVVNRQTDSKPIISQACEQPMIKGNLSSRGEKIYHMPDGRYYGITKAETMFCTEEEAVEAGFRKSKQ